MSHILKHGGLLCVPMLILVLVCGTSAIVFDEGTDSRGRSARRNNGVSFSEKVRADICVDGSTAALVSKRGLRSRCDDRDTHRNDPLLYSLENVPRTRGGGMPMPPDAVCVAGLHVVGRQLLSDGEGDESDGNDIEENMDDTEERDAVDDEQSVEDDPSSQVPEVDAESVHKAVKGVSANNKGKSTTSAKSIPIRAYDAKIEKGTTSPTKKSPSIQSAGNAPDSARAREPQAKAARVLSSAVHMYHHAEMDVNKPVCMIEGVCRTGDGIVLLPKWMEQHKDKLKSCGLSDPRFVLTRDKAAKAGGGDMWVVDAKKLQRTISVSYNFSNSDLFGVEPPREEQHWLVTDMTPTLFMLDVSKRPQAYSSISTHECIDNGDSSCGSKQGPFPKVRPVVLVDVRISGQESYLWPNGFMRLVRNGFVGALRVMDMQEVYGWRIRTHATCFRSLLTTRATTGEFPPRSFGESHFLYSINGLSRASAHPSKNEVVKKQMCTVKVLILNKFGKRHIVGDNRLRLAIAAAASKKTKTHKTLHVLPEVVFFEDSAFHEQVKVMQESRIVVSSHGGHNANLMFLRPDSIFFDVLAFGVRPDTYKVLARQYGIDYRSVMAQPDTEVFESCIRNFNPTAHNRTNLVLAEWKKYAEKFRADSIKRGENADTSYVVPHEDNGRNMHGLERLRQCATYQRLSLNLEHMSQMVADAAAHMCSTPAAK